MEVSARNVPERVLSIAVLFFALITFSSFVGSITTSMTALRSMRADTKKQFWMLRRYLGSKKIPYATRSRIIKFLEFQSAKRSAEVRFLICFRFRCATSSSTSSRSNSWRYILSSHTSRSDDVREM
eukprot:g13443.t2